MTLLLTGGTVITHAWSRPADVRVDGPHIVAVGDLTATADDEVVDCTGCLVFPGGIDPHTHLDLECGPGLITADDFGTGSVSALAGGTTTVIDFATQFHGESLAQGLAHWRTKAEGQAACDYAFHLAMTEWKPSFAEEMPAMVAAGVTSYKLYMAYRHSMMVEDDEIRQALAAAAALGATIGFHCENGRLVDAMVTEAVAAGRRAAAEHPRSRPAELEREAVNRVGVIAAGVGAQHYVVHLSSGSSLPEIAAARGRGAEMVAETCPQYLVLDESRYAGPPAPLRPDGTIDPAELAARAYVMSPPLRTPADNDLLWAALADGGVQFVGTDHCSFLLHGQKDGAADFSSVPNGAPGLELRIPLLYTYGVATGRLSPSRFVAVTSSNAARYFGLYPRKGAVAEGSDADLVVYDPARAGVVAHEVMHDATDHSPYEGLALQGRVRDVYLRGRRVVADGTPVPGEPGGAFLPCGLPDRTLLGDELALATGAGTTAVPAGGGTTAVPAP